VFPATSNKRKPPTNKKWMSQIIFLEGPTRFILPSLQKTGWASEDPNLPIDDRRKIILLYRP